MEKPASSAVTQIALAFSTYGVYESNILEPRDEALLPEVVAVAGLHDEVFLLRHGK